MLGGVASSVLRHSLGVPALAILAAAASYGAVLFSALGVVVFFSLLGP
jgi:hypothetical protein